MLTIDPDDDDEDEEGNKSGRATPREAIPTTPSGPAGDGNVANTSGNSISGGEKSANTSGELAVTPGGDATPQANRISSRERVSFDNIRNRK